MTLTPRLAALLQPLKELIGTLSQPRTIAQVELAQGDAHCALLALVALSETYQQQLRRFSAACDVRYFATLGLR